MKNSLFPEGQFCIELTSEQGLKMFDLLNENKVPFDYIYDGTFTGGCIASDPEKESVVVLNISDEGKNCLASIDHLKET